ncbi:MAG TPA: cysteine desulfurase family protein [Candidatus Nanoarchaeia archaeon]|nr:cysteine desulfurase family protein [Candidatus Nanoarchaeia archaeon]
MVKPIYLDNAATTQVDPRVVASMQPYFTQFYGNPNSSHSFGQAAREAVESAREVIARRIGGQASEIVFTSGGTESNNLAVLGSFGGVRNHVVTTTVEHKSVSEPCAAVRTFGGKSTFVPVDSSGIVDLGVLSRAITRKTALVSVIHGQNEIGTLQDIRAIGKLCVEKDVLFHVDACQSFLKERLDVGRMHIDLLTLNSHKVHGPKGVGALYVRDGVLLRLLVHGGRQEHGLRAGTQNVPGIVGFGKAAALWTERDNEHIARMRDLFVKLIDTADISAQLIGHRTKRLNSIVTYSFGVDAVTMVEHLDSQGVIASTGSACTSHEILPSSVLKALGFDDARARSSVRFSFSRFTTAQDIKTAIEKIRLIVESLRSL